MLENQLFKFALWCDHLLGNNHLLYAKHLLCCHTRLYAKHLLGYNLVRSGARLFLFLQYHDVTQLFLLLCVAAPLFLPLSYFCCSAMPLVFLLLRVAALISAAHFV
jgi:hypothetical protein